MIILLLVNTAIACNWAESETAREILRGRFEKFLSENRLRWSSLSEDCPLKYIVQKDALQSLVPEKKKLSASLWECGKCSKQFRTQEFLERHLVQSHAQYNDKSICLSDLCSYLPCDVPTVFQASRCEKVIKQCFYDDLFMKAKDLCIPKDESSQVLTKNLYAILLVFTVLGLCVFYMILWAEYEETSFNKQKIE